MVKENEDCEEKFDDGYPRFLFLDWGSNERDVRFQINFNEKVRQMVKKFLHKLSYLET